MAFKVGKTDLLPVYYELFDAYAGLLDAVRPNANTVNTIRDYRQLVGVWGLFLPKALRGEHDHRSVDNLLGHIRAVKVGVAGLGASVSRVVLPALTRLENAFEAL